MGVTIWSKRYSCDMGCAGFNRFRNAVAEKVNEDFYNHYLKLSEPEIMFFMGEFSVEENRKEFYKKYNAKTREYISQNIITVEVANFLYQSDEKGKIDRRQAKQIYKLIKDCDDNILYGYIGSSDCAKMSDLKNIFGDRTKVEWC